MCPYIRSSVAYLTGEIREVDLKEFGSNAPVPDVCQLLRVAESDACEARCRCHSDVVGGKQRGAVRLRSQEEEVVRMRVLVIDDDDVARELLSSSLESAGHEVFELASAIGATREIFQHAIDAVVLDVMMPNINGDKLARLLRQNSRGKNLGIVLVSSRPLEELRALSAAAQADAVLQKSAIRAELGECVTRVCEQRSRETRGRTV